jgi:hypothetical protein
MTESQKDNLAVKTYRLDIAKACLGGLITVMVWWFGLRYQQQTADQNNDSEHRRTVVAERVSKYDQIAPLMNDVYSYFEYVGKWKDFTPVDMIKHKRELDSLVYSYSILFDKSFLDAYIHFTDVTYATNTGWGKDAALKTIACRPMDADSPGVSFTNEDSRAAVYEAYWAFQQQAANELDTNLKPEEAGKSKQQIVSRQLPPPISVTSHQSVRSF